MLQDANVEGAFRGSRFHQHVISIDAQRVDSDRGLSIRCAGFGLDLPAVPRADDLVAVDKSLTERASAVRADVIQRAVFAIHVSDADRLIANEKFLRRSFGGKLVNRRDLLKLRHRFTTDS